jgi:hypothetical protein
MSFENAERIFAKPWIGQTAFHKVKFDVLQKLCAHHGLQVPSTGKRGRTRDDCIQTLFNFVSERQ